MSQHPNILLAFYGDDLTGSTDALEFISKAGAKTVLFMEPPTLDQLKAFPDIDAFGVAGRTRSFSPEAMHTTLAPAFERMRESGAKHIHYKVCSTFDSSPVTGSIGKALDCGAAVFSNRPIPILGGTPALGRHCVFGNLFAKMGIGSDGEIYRLDRHPSMSKHPVTPAMESDLRVLLSTQTDKSIGLINILDIQSKDTSQWNEILQSSDAAVLLDALDIADIEKIGEWLGKYVASDQVFSIGSSGIEMALGAYWNKTGMLVARRDWPKAQAQDKLLVLSGSCSPVTAGQIDYAKDNGFDERIVDVDDYMNDERTKESLIKGLVELINAGKSVVVHTGTRASSTIPSEITGGALGEIAREVISRTSLQRVVIAGGDTSSHAARELGVNALEMVTPMVSGAPLCRIHSSNKKIHNTEIILKGGQVGGKAYFVESK